ncbi:hypothetical protein B0H11DRAFT_2031375 [Mycena galericulata]|nr:hypothetical protein B0H11DRAFT_2031375 [Mycena galericulata]
MPGRGHIPVDRAPHPPQVLKTPGQNARMYPNEVHVYDTGVAYIIYGAKARDVAAQKKLSLWEYNSVVELLLPRISQSSLRAYLGTPFRLFRPVPDGAPEQLVHSTDHVPSVKVKKDTPVPVEFDERRDYVAAWAQQCLKAGGKVSVRDVLEACNGTWNLFSRGCEFMLGEVCSHLISYGFVDLASTFESTADEDTSQLYTDLSQDLESALKIVALLGDGEEIDWSDGEGNSAQPQIAAKEHAKLQDPKAKAAQPSKPAMTKAGAMHHLTHSAPDHEAFADPESDVEMVAGPSKPATTKAGAKPRKHRPTFADSESDIEVVAGPSKPPKAKAGAKTTKRKQPSSAPPSPSQPSAARSGKKTRRALGDPM